MAKNICVKYTLDTFFEGDYEYTGDLSGNTEGAYNALVWTDEREKPTWTQIKDAWAMLSLENAIPRLLELQGVGVKALLGGFFVMALWMKGVFGATEGIVNEMLTDVQNLDPASLTSDGAMQGEIQDFLDIAEETIVNALAAQY